MEPEPRPIGWVTFFSLTLIVAPFFSVLSMILVLFAVGQLGLKVACSGESFGWYPVWFLWHEMPWIFPITALVPFLATRKGMPRRRTTQAWLLVAPALTAAWCTVDLLWIYGSPRA